MHIASRVAHYLIIAYNAAGESLAEKKTSLAGFEAEDSDWSTVIHHDLDARPQLPRCTMATTE